MCSLMVDGKGELHTLQRPALTHDTCGLNARPLLLLGALAQLLSGKFVLSGGRLQLFNGAVVDDVDIFRWQNRLDFELSS